ncbi:hypothetical protein ACFYZ8_34440 [Streptomyces sp. NPDC001668]|uniref:hypothetical protein n=1 Tax=Streptomyces sp. NPDC001668 TaxID=3364598 RepID=UPI0036D119F3
MWISVDDGIPQQVRDLTEEHKAIRARRSVAPQWRTRGLPRAHASEVRAAWLEDVQRQQRAGALLDTQDALVEFGVREELRSRGWDHEWDEPPAMAWTPGRWIGSRDRGLDGYPERLSVRLDADLVTRTVAACWWTSAPAIRELQGWRDRHPGIIPPRYELDDEGRARLTGPLAEYVRLADKITTTGTIWRAGVAIGLAQARVVVDSEKAGKDAGDAGQLIQGPAEA